MNICVAVVGFNIVAGNLFQCLGMVRTAIVLSLSRQLLLPASLPVSAASLAGRQGRGSASLSPTS